MLYFLIGLFLFFSLHFYSSFRSRNKDSDIKQKLGISTYMGGYSLISVVGLVLIVVGYKNIEQSTFIYTALPFASKIIPILMITAFIFMVAAYVPNNNIKVIVKHPMLLSVCVWAIAHLIDGADLKQLLLFGSFFIYSLIDIIAVSLRNNTIKTNSSENTNTFYRFDVIVIILGLIAYYVTINWLHG